MMEFFQRVSFVPKPEISSKIDRTTPKGRSDINTVYAKSRVGILLVLTGLIELKEKLQTTKFSSIFHDGKYYQSNKI